MENLFRAGDVWISSKAPLIVLQNQKLSAVRETARQLIKKCGLKLQAEVDPKKVDGGTIFVVTRRDNTSGQCDIVLRVHEKKFPDICEQRLRVSQRQPFYDYESIECRQHGKQALSPPAKQPMRGGKRRGAPPGQQTRGGRGRGAPQGQKETVWSTKNRQ